MAAGNLYESVLAQIARGAKAPEAKPPRASASVVLWRERAGELEVFWIKRSERLRFMGGFHAFPGGGLSRRDWELEVEGRPQGVEESPPVAAMPAAVIDGVENLGPILRDGLLACALRELYEETGVLLSEALVRPGSAGGRPALLEKARQRLENDEIGFAALLSDLDLRLSARRLVYAGRWLTPPLGPIRFDNRFFLLEWPEDRPVQPTVRPGEVESGEWIRPGRALARWHGGRIITAPPILHILTVMAEEGPRRGLTRLREPQEVNLGPHRRIEFRPGVLLFPLKTPTLPPASFTNAYVLGNREAVLVDPGSPLDEESERLRQAMEELRSHDGRTVIAIWLTHHHPDHIGGVETLRRALAVPVCAHRLTAERLRAVGLEVDQELTDDQRVVLAGDPPFPLRVYHTPGHARGHLCFYDETHGSLLVGDLVAGFGTIVIDPPEGNMADYLASLARMQALQPRALFPAHGPAIKDGVVKLEEYLRHRRWRQERILAAWRSGLRQPSAMLSEVYDDVPMIAHPLAQRQIVAHLEHLRALGQLED